MLPRRRPWLRPPRLVLRQFASWGLLMVWEPLAGRRAVPLPATFYNRSFRGTAAPSSFVRATAASASASTRAHPVSQDPTPDVPRIHRPVFLMQLPITLIILSSIHPGS
ncbi:hypothetical protein SEVIR_9G293725v4 [Setaria viridis]